MVDGVMSSLYCVLIVKVLHSPSASKTASSLVKSLESPDLRVHCAKRT